MRFVGLLRRPRPPLSVRERVEIETEAVERFKRHIDWEAMANRPGELTLEVTHQKAVAAGLERLLQEARRHVPADSALAAQIEEALGPAPEPHKEMVASTGGGFTWATLR